MVKCMMCEVTSNLPKMEIVKSLWLSHPEKGVQRPILHELSDDPLWGVTSNHALQLQYVGMVKLSQDPCFTEEHPLLSVGRPPAQSLHCYQHFPATQRSVAAPGDLPELSWSREEVVTVLFLHRYNKILKKREYQSYLPQSPPQS